MDSPSVVLVKHECDVSVGQDIMGGFRNTSLRGFYFQFAVRDRTMHYYFSGSNNDDDELVHHYSVDGVRHGCWRFVVKVEDISDRAIHVITSILRTINICETVQPEMVRKIYSTVGPLARQLEHIPDVKIPVTVDIVRVFRQAVPNPNPQSDGNGNGDEEEDEGKPVPAATSSVAALEKVKLKPKETCTICLGGLIKATRMPCSHVFHQRCIVRWLKRNNDCPLCRFRLPAAT